MATFAEYKLRVENLRHEAMFDDQAFNRDLEGPAELAYLEGLAFLHLAELAFARADASGKARDKRQRAGGVAPGTGGT